MSAAPPAPGAGGQLRLLVLEVDGPAAGHLVVASMLLRHWLRGEGCRPPEWLDEFEATVRRIAVSATGHARTRQDVTTLHGEPAGVHAPPMAPLLLTLDQAASALGVSRRTLQRLVSDGKLEKVDVGERAPRIRAAELERFADSLRRGPAAPAAAPGPDVLRGHRARFKEGA